MYIRQFRKQLKYIKNLIPSAQQQRLYRVAQNTYALVTASSGCQFEWHLEPAHQLQYHSLSTYSNSKKQETRKQDLVEETIDNNDDLECVVPLETTDLHIQKMNTFEHAKDLFNYCTQHEAQLMAQHHVQAIMLFWKLYHTTSCDNTKESISARIKMEVMPRLLPNLAHMSIDELSCCYLYLRKMYIPNADTILEKLLIHALKYIEEALPNSLVPLTAISRFAVGINLGREFFTPLICRNFKPHLEQHIAGCINEEDARLLAISMFQLQSLIDAGLLEDYKTRIDQLLDNKKLNSETPKTVLKVLHMLNAPAWSAQNAKLIRKLLLTLTPCIPQLEPGDLKSVCRTFLHHQEPTTLTQPLKQATQELLLKDRTPDSLSCAVPFATPQQRDNYIALFKQLLYDKANWQLPNASGHFFSILRALKISDVRLCDAYWSAIVDELNASDEEQTQLRFLRHCQRYMNFNNNLGGTYRHEAIERQLTQMAMYAIEYDVAGRLPVKFARLASFVLAYGHTPFGWKKFPNILISKIIAMGEQFSITDCFLISRGMQIAVDLRFRYHVPALLEMQLSIIDTILLACTERQLNEERALNASELNAIVRTLSHRKALKTSLIYNKALERYKQINCNELNSRAVRDMAYNFNASNFFVPNVLESMFDYVAQNHAHISGETVEKVLTCAYNLGYTPQKLEVLDCAANVLMRDFDYMSSLALVQACLALCFYKTIPEELINKVFCVKFIQRVEEEIQVCYSKATYPERVLNLVMQLNRTVCLDFPEANVPWFQQNYIEAQLSKKHVQQNKFNTDVKELLKELLKSENYFRCNHTTPYGYQIDFVIHFDQDRKPLTPPPEEATMLDRITKVAILLMKLDSFCENDLTALRGPESLKMKHLEMMGYKVIHINEHDWNSKYLNAPEAKANYLKCLLQISH